MIIGVGVDIVEIKRIEEAMNRHKGFIYRIFNEVEIEYFNRRNMRSEYVAGRFAAKEAIVKALGTGFSGFDCRDVVIDRAVSGKPVVVLQGKAKLVAQKYGDYKIHLSISHGQETAIAYAVLEVEKNENCRLTDHE